MKKIFAALLLFACILNIMSCSQGNESKNTESPDTKVLNTEAPGTKEPEVVKEVALTPSNLSEYLKITCTSKNVKIENEALGMKRGTCDIEIQTFLLKNVDLEGVKLKLNCKAGSIWHQVVELEVPFNGSITEVFKTFTIITSEYISPNPMFSIEIQEVSGKVILK